MRIVLFAICSLFLSLNSFAQRPDPYFYLDSNFVATTSPDYHYIRVIKNFYSKQGPHTVTEFYRTGEPYSIGTISDAFSRKKIGEFTYYYKNGHPKINRYFNGEPTGIYQEWYEDGRVKLEGMYLPSNADSTIIDKLQIHNYWDKNNVHQVINGNGFYAVDEGDVKLSGQLKNGLRDSIWNGSIRSLKALFKESYAQGKLVNGVSTTYGDVKHEYTTLRQECEPQGGGVALQEIIKKNLKFANRSITVGTNIIFRIDVEGQIAGIHFPKGVGIKNEEELIRLLQQTSPWRPQRLRGVAVRSTFALPYTFGAKNYGRPYEPDPFQAVKGNTQMPAKVYVRPTDAITGW